MVSGVRFFFFECNSDGLLTHHVMSERRFIYLLYDLFPAKVLSFFFNLSKVLGKCKTLNLVLCERIPSGWYILC